MKVVINGQEVLVPDGTNVRTALECADVTPKGILMGKRDGERVLPWDLDDVMTEGAILDCLSPNPVKVLEGAKITKVFKYDNGWDSYHILYLDNGLFMVAPKDDGREAIAFITEAEVAALVRETEEYQE